MLLSRYFALLTLAVFSIASLQAQTAREIQDYGLLLHTGRQEVAPNMDVWTNPAAWEQLDKVGSSYFAVVQFYEMPDAALRHNLQQKGLHLLEYIPHLAFYAKITNPAGVAAMGQHLRAVYALQPADKLARPVLERPLPEGNRLDQGRVLLRVYYQSEAAIPGLEAKLPKYEAEIRRHFSREKWMEISVAEDYIEALAGMDEVRFVELFPTEGRPDDTHGRSLHRVNRIQGEGATLGHYTGKGVNVIVRDDGIVGPHIDFKGRLNQQFAFNDNPGRSHGDGVSGILGGAGNLDPDNAGMATEATLHILNYRQDLMDSVEYLEREYGALVVSTSYSDGCNVGYTGNARTIDRQTWEHPTLLHVFSAGNNNNNSCGYGAGDQWGNVTGGHKMGKNAIATANVFYEGSIVASSSRGPAHDGRLKPEISAYGQGQISTFADNTYDGFGGTSAAAPGISGVIACLQQAYAEFNGGNFAEAALMKAAVMNTANDLGTKGPDFQYGFGLVNAYRALKLIEQEQYQAVSLDQGGQESVVIELDRPAKELRVMLYWTDEPGSLFSRRALVNDLDITVTSEDQTQYFPLVLDHSPDPVKLALPAVPGVDHLNNVEQVIVTDAQAGSYTVNITGFEVPNGAVKAWLVYNIVEDSLEMSYPHGGEAFEPGSTETIRWDAPDNANSFNLAVSYDNGNSWNEVALVNGALRTYDWEVPVTRTGEAIFRVTNDRGIASHSRPFSIFQRPVNVVIARACPDRIVLRFDSVADATAYLGYRLGDQLMEEVAMSTTNEIEIPVKSPEVGEWVAVSAIGDNGKKSKRTVAIYYEDGLQNCRQDNDLRLARVVSPVSGIDNFCLDDEKLVTIEITNTGFAPQSDFSVNYRVNEEDLVTESFQGTIPPGETVAFTFSEPIDPISARKLDLWLDLSPNDYDYDDSVSMELQFQDRYVEDIPYVEDFNDFDSMLLTWLVETSDEAENWTTRKVIQADGSTAHSLSFRNWDAEFKQKEFGVQSGKIPLVNMKNPWLFYNLSYANRDMNKVDQLALEVSNNCGNSFTRIFTYDPAEMNTWTPLPVEWEPRRGRHWRRDSIRLEGFAGQEIVIRWVNISGGGNNVFIDDFTIEDRGSVNAQNRPKSYMEGISVFPNPAGETLHLDLSKLEKTDSELKWTITDLSGKVWREQVLGKGLQNRVKLDLSPLQCGIYFLKLTDNSTGQFSIQRFVKQ